MLVYAEDSVPTPRRHRKRLSMRAQLKDCVAASVAAEWCASP
eukprot:COSAG06_NODE_9417_length_1907_cov_1.719027_3_plen_41_part_01